MKIRQGRWRQNCKIDVRRGRLHGICGLSLLHLKTEKNKENICKQNDGQNENTYMKRVLKNKLPVISDEIKKITKSILAYCEISSKIEVVSHDCLFFNNLGEEAV